MLVIGVVASDLSLLLYRASVELALSPFSVFLAFMRDGAPEAGARPRGPNPRSGQASALQLARDSLYAAQLRRAAPVVRLFAAAPPGGEREAAYHALARLAAAANAALGVPPGGTLITPGALYRDLTRGVQGWRTPDTGAPTFDARVCAELDQRDVPGP